MAREIARDISGHSGTCPGVSSGTDRDSSLRGCPDVPRQHSGGGSKTDTDRTADHKAKVRATLAKIDPGMVAWLDAVKAMDPTAKLHRVEAVQDGEWRAMGQWPKWPEDQR